MTEFRLEAIVHLLQVYSTHVRPSSCRELGPACETLAAEHDISQIPAYSDTVWVLQPFLPQALSQLEVNGPKATVYLSYQLPAQSKSPTMHAAEDTELGACRGRLGAWARWVGSSSWMVWVDQFIGK